MVDASKCKMYIKNFGEFFINQIEHAGTIILSRTDVASPEKVQQAVDLIREHNSRAALITTPIVQLDGKEILKTIEDGSDLEKELMKEVLAHREEEHDHEHCHDHGHHHDHDHEDSCCCTMIMTMSITTTMNIIMTTIMMGKDAAAVMTTSTTMTMNITTIIMAIIMRTMCSQAGAWRRPHPTPEKRWRVS